jgi:hypothetical protein
MSQPAARRFARRSGGLDDLGMVQDMWWMIIVV